MDHMTDHAAASPAEGTKPIRPLDAFERRVLGVLIEKAKTTPDQYPLSLNGVVVGCNQKSNRDPVMTVDEEQVSRAIEGLRKCGAAAEVFGSGKLPRYRHLAYDWLRVGKEELAIMGELLLRGEQTEGDLRGRASRMDPIPDLDALRGHLDRLAEKGLVIWLSPPGRGRMLTHGLLPQEKLDKVRAELGLAAAAAASTPAPSPSQAAPHASRTDASATSGDDRSLQAPIAAGAAVESSASLKATTALESRITELEREVAALRDRLTALEDALGA
ncbi:MAG: YceH family protein [Pirellulales bacterium]